MSNPPLEPVEAEAGGSMRRVEPEVTAGLMRTLSVAPVAGSARESSRRAAAAPGVGVKAGCSHLMGRGAGAEAGSIPRVVRAEEVVVEVARAAREEALEEARVEAVMGAAVLAGSLVVAAANVGVVEVEARVEARVAVAGGPVKAGRVVVLALEGWGVVRYRRGWKS